MARPWELRLGFVRPGAQVASLLIRLAAAILIAIATPSIGQAQEKVQFRSLDDSWFSAATQLDGYLYRPAVSGARPALVFLHGCSGLLSKAGAIRLREADWAARLTAAGYVVLMVDSFTPRGRTNLCDHADFDPALYRTRPKDAYGALRYLQQLPFVRPDRIGVIGWSQGGGTVLLAIPAASEGRPLDLPQGDFRAAVAFYPGSCNERRHREPWSSPIPLLILIGSDDNWTPEPPCSHFAEAARARGSPITIQIYPGAVHGFDAPNQRRIDLERVRTLGGETPVIGTDPAARDDSRIRVLDFLGRYLND